MKNIIPLLIICFAFSCTNTSNSNLTKEQKIEESIINERFAGHFINDTIFEIDPLVKNVLETSNGSSVLIPANCLLNNKGELVKEKVDITFKQYHSVLDIIVSGIPMDYDTLGQTYSFESAGMFNLTATCKTGEKLALKEQSKIEVNLGSDKEEKFNFYELDEQTGTWTCQPQTHKIKANKKYDPSVKIIEPKQGDENQFVLDLNFDVSSYKELDLFSGIVWEYTGDNDSLDPRKNDIGKTNWTDFNLEPTYEKAYEYFLTMSTSKKSFVTKVKASLKGADFDLAMQAFNAQKIEMVKKIENLQKPFIRSVNISGFGTYNYDYIHKIEDPAELLADFSFDSESEKDHALIAVVYEKEDVVVNYPQDKWKLFSLDKKSTPKIIAVLPDNTVAVYKGNVKRCYNKKKFTFKMEVLKDKIKDKSDLLKAIQNI